MPQDWQEHNLRHSFRQSLRSRKPFLPFNFLIFLATLGATLLFHSLSVTPVQSQTQTQPTLQPISAPAKPQSNIQLLVPPLDPSRIQAIPQSQPSTRAEIRGVWLTSNDFSVFSHRQRLSEALQQLKQLNFNTIYPVVWNSGYVMFPSAIAQKEGIQPFTYRGNEGHDIIADIIDQAHQNDLLVMPWFEFGFMAPPTSELAVTHPQWLTQQRNGDRTSITAAGEVAWLNPFHPEVQQFLTDLVMEAVNKYDLDGIQFDDHTSLPKTFGYDRYTSELYRQETKKSPPADVNDPAWVRWRANKITAFMTRLNKAVKQRKPHVIFSVSPNYYEFAYKEQLQDWLGWVRQGLVDELLVQVYRPDIEDFRSIISRPEIIESQNKIPTAIAVLSGLRNSNVPMSRVFTQAMIARGRGLGISFFYYRSLWGYGPESIDDRQRDFQRLFPFPVPRLARR